MMANLQRTAPIVLGLLAFALSADAFSILRLPEQQKSLPSALFGKARRGKLASLVDADDVVASATLATAAKAQKSRKGKRTQPKKSGVASGDTISPALAQWASESTTESDAATDSNSESDLVTTSASFESFDKVKVTKKKNKRKSNKKPSIREQAMAERDQKAELLMKNLQAVLESDDKTKDINDLLAPIRQLVTLPSATEKFRSLTAGSKEVNNYRLAWVGSDDAVCHIGTSLHKVPLARLQEVFLELPGRNRVQLLEVIRVIGPFPNVKNTLVGTSAKAKSTGAIDDADLVEWKITWDSMTDGTGKELLAGKKENTRTIELMVAFCTEDVLVATVPPKDKDGFQRREDLFENNGENLLVFVREDNLEQKLDALRVG